jgi:conjugative relaxase-like TrwC/TraI family protein
MFSIHTAASIYYYLGIQPGHEAETALFGKDVDRGSTTYYQSVDASDPLFETAVWTGKLAEAVGLEPGSIVRPGHLAAMWFGMHPGTREPLEQRGLTFQEQIQAQTKLAEADTELHLATRAMAKLRNELKKGPIKQKDINQLAGIRQIQARIDQARVAVKEATSSKSYRAGPHDATFSAPKSVSIYWARLKSDTNPATMAQSHRRAKEIEAAMLASSKSVIDGYIEPNLVFTRDKAGSRTTYENVKGLATALFLHFESRPTINRAGAISSADAHAGADKLPDPQLHVHGLLMSMGISQDDDVRAIWSTFLGSHAKAIGAAFRAELAARLRELDLDLRMDVQANVSGFELAGVAEDQIGEFSARRAQVKGNLDRGQTSEAAVLSGREVKRDYSGTDLLKAWDSRLSAAAIDSRSIEAATVAGLAKQVAALACGNTLESCDTSSRDFQRHYDAAIAKLACRPPTVAEAIEKLLSMESSITMEAITRFSFEASQYCSPSDLDGRSPIQWAKNFKTAILRTPDLRPTGELDRYKRPTFVSQRMVDRENKLYHTTIPSLSRPSGLPLNVEVIDAAIHAFEASRSKGRPEAFALLPFQREMVHAMAAGGQNLVAYVAPAGCGKTTAARGAVDAWEAAGRRVITMAPSHSAAGQLAVDLGRDESLGIVPQSLLKKIATGKMSLTKNDVLFIDEASMIDFDTAERLVMAASQAEGGPAKVVLMGDSEQLPSVGRGNFFRKVVEQGEAAAASDTASDPYVFRVARSAVDWTKINRQQADIGKQATAFLATGQTSMAMDIYERLGAVRLQGTRDECLEEMADRAMDLIATPAAKLKALHKEHRDKFSTFDAGARAKYLTASKNAGTTTSRENFLAMMRPDERAMATEWLDSLDAIKLANSAVRAKLATTMMLATTRTEVSQLNVMARSALKDMGYIDQHTFAMVKRGRVGSMEICVGERIAFNGRMGAVDEASGKKIRIAKSAIATVKHIAAKPGGNGSILTLEMEGNGRTVSVDTSQFADFNYAYAMTVHKSQGMTFEHVLQLIGTFVHSETNYVAMSRYRKTHTLFGVSSEYQTYKERASVALEKLEASDHGFVAANFSLTGEQATAIEIGVANAKTEAVGECENLKRYAQVAIARGILLEHGPAIANGIDTYAAKLDVFGQVVELRGPGLSGALDSINARVGQAVGLEPLCPSSDGARDGVAWRAYTEEALQRAGISFDELSVARETQATFDLAKDKPATMPSAYGTSELSLMLSSDESLVLLAKQVVRAAQVAASIVQERASQAQASMASSTWTPSDAQLQAAKKCLPFARPSRHGHLYGKVMDGITVQRAGSPSSDIQRDWLAHDTDCSYCLSESGVVEAWRTEGLPSDVQRKIGSTAPDVKSLLTTRAEVLKSAREQAHKPVMDAFGKHASSIDAAIFEDPKNGLCLGVGVHDDRLLSQSPLLRKLFVDDGAPQKREVNNPPKGGIARLKHHAGYNPTLKMWMFPIGRLPSGLPSSQQQAAGELAEHVARLVHEGEASTATSAAPPRGRWADAWDAIEGKLNSPWGYGYAYGAKAGGSSITPADILSSLAGKEKDIVLWDANISERERTKHWQLFSNTGNTGRKLPETDRIFSGVVLHDDREHIYLLRDQRIVAIPKATLQVGPNAKLSSGMTIEIVFRPGRNPSAVGKSSLAPVFAMSATMTSGEISQARKDNDVASEAAKALAGTEHQSAEDVSLAIAWARTTVRDRQQSLSPAKDSSQQR